MDSASRSAESRIFYGTRARRAILLLLRTGRRYFSASEIHQSLKAEMPSTAMSTVYRTLEMLEGFGTVSRRAEEGKEATFVYCGEEHHHHAICRVCGHVDDVRCDAIDQIKESLERQRAFELDDHTIEFYGRCARCRPDPLTHHNENGAATVATDVRISQELNLGDFN